MNDSNYSSEDAMCVAILASAGVHVSSVLDLIGQPPIRQALPVLCELLPRVSNNLIREAIVRCLSVREARGIASNSLLHEFHRVDKRDLEAASQHRAIAIAIAMVATDTDFYSIIDILSTPDYSDYGKGPLVLALTRMDALWMPASNLLIQLLDDENLVEWAIMALKQRGDDSSLLRLERLSADAKTHALRTAAKETIDAIRHRISRGKDIVE